MKLRTTMDLILLRTIRGGFNPSAVIAAARRYPLIPIAILIIVLVIPAAFANILSPYDPRKGDLNERLIPPFWVEDKLETIHIFSELDRPRRTRLLDYVTQNQQVFLSTSDPSNLDEHFLHQSTRYIVEHGNIKRL